MATMVVKTARTEAEIDEQVAALLKRPYQKVITGDPENGYLAKAPELPGCITEGDTEADALVMLNDAMAGWFEVMLRSGEPIPEPQAMQVVYNGKYLFRMPKTVHRELAERAEAEGTTINQLVLTYVSRGLGLAHTG